MKQRTESVNALRSRLYEFGHVAPDADLPDLPRDICRMLIEQIAHLTDWINSRRPLFV